MTLRPKPRGGIRKIDVVGRQSIRFVCWKDITLAPHLFTHRTPVDFGVFGGRQRLAEHIYGPADPHSRGRIVGESLRRWTGYVPLWQQPMPTFNLRAFDMQSHFPNSLSSTRQHPNKSVVDSLTGDFKLEDTAASPRLEQIGFHMRHRGKPHPVDATFQYANLGTTAD